MKAKALVRTMLFAAGVALLGSCTPDGGTIYATIETEAKIVDNTLPNTLTVGDMVSTAPNTYYVAAGQLYKGILDVPTNTIAWTSLKTIPTGALATTLASLGTTVWGGFITSGTVLGLYSTTAPDTTNFAQVGAPVVQTKQVYGVSTVASTNDLFVVCAVLSGSNYVYELENYNTVSTTWTGSLLSGIAVPIVGVATDGASFYAASGTSIYSAATAAGAYSPTSETLAAGDAAQGIFGDVANSRVFVATRTGGLYYYHAGWTHVAAPQLNSAPVPFLSVAGPIDSGADKYLVGSDGFGYFVFSVSGGTFARFSGSTIGLWSGSVRRILLDGTTVLMGTNGAGLWRAKLDASGNLIPPTGPALPSDSTNTTQTAAAWSQE
jgi:hypothetical protein